MDRRILLTLVAIIIVGGIFFVVRSQTSHHTAQNLTFDLRVKGDNMVPDTISATQGDTITLSVASDRAFELHVHGYNWKLKLKPGKATVVTFKANLSGSFEMENEGEGHHLGTLTVNPS